MYMTKLFSKKPGMAYNSYLCACYIPFIPLGGFIMPTLHIKKLSLTNVICAETPSDKAKFKFRIVQFHNSDYFLWISKRMVLSYQITKYFPKTMCKI